MIINNLSSVREHWFDRVPAKGNIKYLGTGLANHAYTQRATYTVPANKILIVSGVMLYLLRATGGDGDEGIIGLSLGAADSQDDFSCHLRLDGNGDAAEMMSEYFNPNLWLVAADTIDIYSYSAESTGTITMCAHVDYLTFDA